MYVLVILYRYVYINTSGSWPTGTAAPILRLAEAALERSEAEAAYCAAKEDPISTD